MVVEKKKTLLRGGALPTMGYIGLLFIQNISPSLIRSNLPAIFS